MPIEGVKWRSRRLHDIVEGSSFYGLFGYVRGPLAFQSNDKKCNFDMTASYLSKIACMPSFSICIVVGRRPEGPKVGGPVSEPLACQQ